MQKDKLTHDELCTEAGQQKVIANELDILVSKTREITMKKGRDIRRISDLLKSIENKIH